MKKIVGWVSGIAAIVLIFSIWGNFDDASRIESASDLRYDNLDITPDLETESGSINPSVGYEQATDFINGIAWVEKAYNYYDQSTGDYGMIDTAGNFVIPFIYENVSAFDYYTRGATWVCLAETEKWGLIDTAGIDTAGNIIVPFTYDGIRQINNDGHAWVMLDEKTGLVSAEGNVLVPAEYEEVFFYKDGIAAVMLDKKWGFIDSGNNVIVPFAYDYVSPFSNGLARVVIADDGNAYFPNSYSAPEIVWLKGKFGFVDLSGNVVIPIIYDYAFPELDKDGFITVELDGRTGTIDKSGEIIVPFH